MKYIVVLGDGMADYRLSQLGNMTPLQRAVKPNMDYLAAYGETGMVRTIPEGIPPGSDAANLSVMGYDPRQYYTGRSPLEAISMGVELSADDLAFRCNLVTLSEEEKYEDKIMVDYSSDEITSEESALLIEEVNRHFKTDIIRFHAGISYRHCMVWENCSEDFRLTPPHDILERRISDHLPGGSGGTAIMKMMKESYSFLKGHPVNAARMAKGLRPANSIWLWGQGRKPAIPKFGEKYGLNGSVVSAVDLIKGIGICAGLRSVDVEGTTGNIHTNFSGKAKAALKELESGADFVYVHIEAPDECGHRYEIENKVKAIEYIDKQVLGTMLEGLGKYEEYSLLILPDHPTPLSLRTHTPEPVPYILYRSGSVKESGVKGYDEFQAQKTGVFVEEGHRLMDRFIKGGA